MNGQARNLAERMRSKRLSVPLQQTPSVVIAAGRASAHVPELAADLAQAFAQHERPTYVMELPHSHATLAPLVARRAPDLPCWTSDGRAWSEQLDAHREGNAGGVLLVGAGTGTDAVTPLTQASVGLIVLEQRPQAVRSAYALVKRVVLADPSAASRLVFVVCPVHRPAKAKQVTQGLHDMVRRFLGVEVDDLELAGIGASPAERRLGLRLLTRRVLTRCAKAAVSGKAVAVA